MLKLTIVQPELYNDVLNEFTPSKFYKIQLEHSLVSLSKWESNWKKPFLSNDEKTLEETIDYIKCMTITQNVPDDVYNYISNDQYNQILEYIHSERTATTLPSLKSTGRRQVITSELIYYWMIVLNIPFECQKWHLSRLLTLINVCDIKNSPPKKMSKKEIATRNAELNAARRKSLGSQG